MVYSDSFVFNRTNMFYSDSLVFNRTSWTRMNSNVSNGYILLYDVDVKMEPDIIYTTVRSSYDVDADEDYGFHLECRFSDGQKFAAVQIDREFPNLAHRISDLLNGWIDIKKEKPHSDNSSPYYLFVKDNYLPFIGFWDKEKEECRYDGEVCYPSHWFDLNLIGGRM